MRTQGESRIFTLVPLVLVIIVVCLMGCATVKEIPVLDGQNRITIREGWGREPDRRYSDPGKLKYGADEIWIYEYMGGNAETRYYFRNSVLIKREEVSYATL
ncbi:MAG: hypothetical protein ACW990_18080 [Promethearchaeota archaeon]|jgi:hypothetical protein